MESLVIGDALGEKLAQFLNWDYLLVKERIFPDGEIKPSLGKEEKVDQIILLLQKQDKEKINDYLIKYFLLARKAKELAKKVIGIMPYLPYARQDAVFEEGEPLSALYIDELIEKNLDTFITCNMHEHRKKIKELFKIPAYNLFLFQDLASQFQDFNPLESIVLGPDRESKTFVDDFCQKFPAQKIVLIKERNNQTGQIEFSYSLKDLEVIKNKDIIIVDDIVSTGNTILDAAKITNQFQARSISFAFVHSIFGDQSINALKIIHPKKIITTNTLANSQFTVDISQTLSRFLKSVI
ncbi:MAG: ribose-phosphate diphosphokinase [Minisyncoccia bacterium]